MGTNQPVSSQTPGQDFTRSSPSQDEDILLESRLGLKEKRPFFKISQDLFTIFPANIQIWDFLLSGRIPLPDIHSSVFYLPHSLCEVGGGDNRKQSCISRLDYWMHLKQNVLH